MLARVAQLEYESGAEIVPIHRIDRPERLKDEQVQAVLRLLRKAYAHQFEGEEGAAVAIGTFKQAFDPHSSDQVRKKGRQMREDIANGAAYLFIPSAENSRHWHGLAKTTPSRATHDQKAGNISPNCYLADLVIDPKHQRKKRGTMLLHAALAYGEFEPQRALALDAFQNNEVTSSWLGRLGLVKEDIDIEPLQIGEASLPQARYTTPPGLGIAEVQQKLELSLQLGKE